MKNNSFYMKYYLGIWESNEVGPKPVRTLDDICSERLRAYLNLSKVYILLDKFRLSELRRGR